MKFGMRHGLLLALLWLPGIGNAQITAPVIGGPCQGCELVFAGLPDTLESRARITGDKQPGEAMTLTGVVTTRAGAPAAGIVIYAYQTDAGGIYPKAETWHGGLRAWAQTGSDGHYRFDTIRPGAYPGRSEPQHIHLHVIEPGVGTYYIDDVVFDDDPLLTANHRNRRTGRGGNGLSMPRRDADGVWQVQRDIVLGQAIPGHADR